jgi:hypothetical protein
MLARHHDHESPGGEALLGVARAVVAGDQDAQHPGDLLLACRSSVQFAAHLGKPTVDPGELTVDLGELAVYPGEAAVDVRPEVGKVFAHRVEHSGVLLPELPDLRPHLGHVAIRAASQHTGCGSVLLTVAHAFAQITDLLLERGHASLEIRWLGHNREHSDPRALAMRWF